jgi:hypothetical protein
MQPYNHYDCLVAAADVIGILKYRVPWLEPNLFFPATGRGTDNADANTGPTGVFATFLVLTGMDVQVCSRMY